MKDTNIIPIHPQQRQLNRALPFDLHYLSDRGMMLFNAAPKHLVENVWNAVQAGWHPNQIEMAWDEIGDWIREHWDKILPTQKGLAIY